MSAAHELVERGFAVEVYERRTQTGGKARSMGVPGTGKDGRPDLPGEHGFRFFPGFYRHLPELITNGNVFLAQPPLYRIDVGKETHWALDDAEKDRILAKLPKNQKAEISRFKGLGEMPAEDLKATTLDPRRRRALSCSGSCSAR